MELDYHVFADYDGETTEILREFQSAIENVGQCLVERPLDIPSEFHDSGHISLYLLSRIYRGAKAIHCLSCTAHSFEANILERAMLESYLSLAWLISAE